MISRYRALTSLVEVEQIPDALLVPGLRSRVRAVTALAMTLLALLGSSGVASATPTTTTTGAGPAVLPLQAGEICNTPAGDFMQLVIWVAIFMFFGVIVAAIFLGGAIEALPVSGWWMQTGYSMMGRVPIAVGFVLFGISVLVLAVNIGSLDVPPCIPILG